MKYLILLIVLALIVLWASAGRRREVREAQRRAPRAPREVVACARCGVHLPRDEALPSPDGRWFCCDEHRRSAGAAR